MKSQISHVSERNKKFLLFITHKPQGEKNPELNIINATGAEALLPETIPLLKCSLGKNCVSAFGIFITHMSASPGLMCPYT